MDTNSYSTLPKAPVGTFCLHRLIHSNFSFPKILQCDMTGGQISPRLAIIWFKRNNSRAERRSERTDSAPSKTVVFLHMFAVFVVVINKG